MVLTQITTVLLNFISRNLSKIRSFTGKSQITNIKNNNISIRNIISRALRSTEFYLQAISLESHYNDWVSKMGMLHIAYNDWDTAKQNYDSSNLEVTRYTRLLSNSRRSRNSSQISRYITLLSRARTSRNRRQTVMNTKYNTMMSRANSAGASAIQLWRDYQNLQGLLS